MHIFLSFIALVVLVGCSTSQVIRDSEYKFAQAAYQFSDPETALTEFPKKEKRGFVTTIEKSWIGLWTDRIDQTELLRQARTLDDRKFTSIRRETEYFFFSESDEGYIPAEHEVVIMHLISATYFMKNQEWAKARVEAVGAAYFLQSFFSPEQKHFDDPALRVWLAGIWASLGEWNEAEVDFRRAYELSKDKSLLPLIDKTRPPEAMNIVFSGAGPVVEWKFGELVPHFSQREPRPNERIAFSTLPWFERHQLRNSAIREKVTASRYMSQYYGTQVSKGGEKTFGFVSSATVKAAGVFLGTAVVGGGIYLLAATGATDISEIIGPLFGAGATTASYFWQQGDTISDTFSRSANENDEKAKEDLKIYRYVRFLPSWISVTESPTSSGSSKELAFQAPNSRTKVHFVQQF